MGKIKLTRVYHIGLPVNDFERSKSFYRDVLGLRVLEGTNTGERDPANAPFREILGYWPETLRLLCANDNVTVVLFKRPKAIERDWKQDSFTHTAFSSSKEDFDLALQKMKEWGVDFVAGPIDRGNGRTLYFFDPDHNLIQLDDRG